jgi:branched-chain amino acid transport system permease protein
MSEFVAALFGGAFAGAIYALIGVGLVLVFRATQTFNFAHGEVMALAALVLARWQMDRDGPFGVGLLIALLVSALVGAAFYQLVLRRAVGLPPYMGLVATLGLAAVIDGTMTLIYGSNQYALRVPGLGKGNFTIFGAGLSTTGLILAVAAVALTTALALVLRLTRLGVRVRAAGQNAILASQGGIQVRRLYMASWALSMVLAALAGVAYGATNIVTSSISVTALAAFPAIILGGLDSIEGAIIGGLAIGIVQGFVAAYINSGQVVNLATYAILLVVLLLRPEGLLGTRDVRRV